MCAPKPTACIKCDDRTWFYTLQGRSPEEVTSLHRTGLQEQKKATLCFPLNFSLLQLATKETPMRFFYWCGV
jgi:hypothetical protein